MAEAARAWLPAVEPDVTPVPAPPPAARVLTIDEGPVEWAESPARLLHARLAATFVTPPPRPSSDDALSPRAKVAIMLGSTAILWAALIGAVAAVV